MKILCISDIHGHFESIPKIIEFMKKEAIDYIFILGDFSEHSRFRNIGANREDIIKILEYFKKFKIKAIPGNCDHLANIDIFDKYDANLHEKVFDIGNVKFVGFGGSNVTPFNSPTEWTEDDIYKKCKKLMDNLKDNNIVIISHFPPKDTKCDDINGSHVGSSSLRKIIEEFNPHLCLCGHIHEAGGTVDSIGKTQIISVGMVSSNNMVIIETDNITARQLKLP